MRLFTRRDQKFPRDKKYFIDQMWNAMLMNLFFFYDDPPGSKNAKGEWSIPWQGNPNDVTLRCVLFFPLDA